MPTTVKSQRLISLEETVRDLESAIRSERSRLEIERQERIWSLVRDLDNVDLITLSVLIEHHLRDG